MTREQKQTVSDALSTVNPFVLRSETGRIILYENAKECYEFCPDGTIEEYPCGAIDVAGYMMKYQRLDPVTIWKICRRRDYAFIRWEEKSPERNQRLQAVLRLLLKPSGCPLDEDLFQQSREGKVKQTQPNNKNRLNDNRNKTEERYDGLLCIGVSQKNMAEKEKHA